MNPTQEKRKSFEVANQELWADTVVDSYGNNVAFKCSCGRVFIVSGFLGHGSRTCPACKKYKGVVDKGGKTASLSPL